MRRRLGSGGFATVWLAYDEQLDAEVAVKVLADNWAHDDSVRRRFLEEGRFLRRVESEHVVQVHDVGEMEDGRPFLVLTYADRGTLADRLKEEPLVLEAAIGVVVQVGRGLQALHRRGLLHRDVKPANVLFRSTDEGERAVLSDLGLGKSLDEVSRITMPGGTPSYVAPEQAMGERLDQRADQYSLGAVAYAALTGRSPHQVDGLGAAGRVKAAPPPSSLGFAVPDKVDAAIVRALDPDREKRWPDVVSFTRELVGALDETTHGFVAAGLKRPAGLAAATEPATTKPATTAPAATAPAATEPARESPDESAIPAGMAGAEAKAGAVAKAAAGSTAGAQAGSAGAAAMAGAEAKAGTADAEAGGSTGSAELPTETVDPAGGRTALSESNAPTVVRTPNPSMPTPGTASSGTATFGTASSGTASPGVTARPEAAETSAAAAEANASAARVWRRRRRRRWVVAAVLALIIGGGAGFGAQRYLEPRLLVDVNQAPFSLKVPHAWKEGAVARSDWRPPGSNLDRPAIRVSQNADWATPGQGTPGVFVGSMSRDGDIGKYLAKGEQYGCSDDGTPDSVVAAGLATVQLVSKGCSNGTMLLQVIKDIGTSDRILIQVLVPDSDRKRASEVAESVSYSFEGNP